MAEVGDLEQRVRTSVGSWCVMARRASARAWETSSKPRTSATTTASGPTAKNGASYMLRTPSRISEPSDGCGGRTPRPRKLIAPSMNTATDIETASCTSSGSIEFGSTCRRSCHSDPAPTTCAASTYGISRTVRTEVRVSRPKTGISTATITTTTVRSPGPTNAVSAIARISVGNASTRSKTRWATTSANGPPARDQPDQDADQRRRSARRRRPRSGRSGCRRGCGRGCRG